MAISHKLRNIYDTKMDLAEIIDDANLEVPTLFSDYPDAFVDLLDNSSNIYLLMDKVVLESTVTLTEVEALFESLPYASSYTRSVTVGTYIDTGFFNIRSSANGPIIGKMLPGDETEMLTTTRSWDKIRSFRMTDTNRPLRTYNYTSAYCYATTGNMSFATKQVASKVIDMTQVSAAVQKACDAKIAEDKGWEVLFTYGTSYDPGATETGTTTGGGTTTTAPTTTKTFEFDDLYTTNYTNSSYTTITGSGKDTSYLRQGYYNSKYFKANFRFKTATLTNVKNALKASNITSIQVYVERKNSNHGNWNSASTVALYASDSTGKNADYLIVDGTVKLNIDQGSWVTVPTAVKDGFISGKYDHIKAYSTDTTYTHYILYENGTLKASGKPKLRINIG